MAKSPSPRTQATRNVGHAAEAHREVPPEVRPKELYEGGIPGDARPRSANLVATVQYLVFEPGLYSVDIIADHSAPTDMGLALPCVRIEAVPATTASPGKASVVDPRGDGWLWRRADPSFVLVTGGRAGALISIFRADDGMAAPEIRIRHINTTVGIPAKAAVARFGQGEGGVPLALLAHITRVGDVTEVGGGWLGGFGSGVPVEGFAITPAATLRPEDIEYQAILGTNWSTPWFAGGEFCGSRGLMLPLLGLCVRLKGEAAAAFECCYQGRFIGGQTRGPCRDGETCQAGDAPLEAFQVVVRRRQMADPSSSSYAGSTAAETAPAVSKRQRTTKPKNRY